MIRSKSIFSISLGGAILIVGLLSCNVAQSEVRTTALDQYYAVESTTLLASLQQRDMSAFIPTEERPELSPDNQQLPGNWLQADYFYITETLYNGVLAHPLQDWNLKGMDFRLNCADVGIGLQNGRLEYFKIIKESSQESRIERFIEIDVRRNFVHLIDEKFTPSLSNLNAINLARLKVSAEQAIQIAEENGGLQERQNAGNMCRIFAGLYPNAAHYNGWAVSYALDSNNTSVFYIEIDPYTGEIR